MSVARTAVGHRQFDFERVALGPHPRRFDRLLQAHAVVDQIDQRLHCAWKDPLSAGQAERIDELAVAQRHDRRHRGGDALARRQRQRVAGTGIIEVHVIVRDGAEAGNQNFGAEQIVDGLGGRDHIAERIRRRHMRRVCAFELRHAGRPALRTVWIDRAAAFGGIGLRGQPLDRHVDEVRIAAGGGAVGEGDLEHLGEIMDRGRRAEAELCDIIAFENVEHLRDVHAGGRGRRRSQNLPAAIIGADWLAFDGLVAREILAGDEAAIPLHVVDEDIAERTVIQRRLATLGDVGQRFRIFRLHHALTNLQRRPLGQIDRRNLLVLQHLLGAVGNTFVQVGRRRIAARGVLDRGLHDIGERHGAETLQRLAPGLQ